MMMVMMKMLWISLMIQTTVATYKSVYLFPTCKYIYTYVQFCEYFVQGVTSCVLLCVFKCVFGRVMFKNKTL